MTKLPSLDDFPFDYEDGSKKFKYGTKPDLKAKSHHGPGSTLTEHSLYAAQMALTVSETVIVDTTIRNAFRTAAFIGGLFHDLGKAAAGFQEMIKNRNVYRWPPRQGGFRHEMLSMIIFASNVLDTEAWNSKPEIVKAIYLSIIVHHKPFKSKYSKNTYPKGIDREQWPGRVHFKTMYCELLLNKKILENTWIKITVNIRSDSWGRELFDLGYLPNELKIPPTVEDAVAMYDRFLTNFGIPGFSQGFVDEHMYRQNVTQELTRLLSYVRAVVTVGDHLSSGSYLFLPPIPDLSKYDVTKKFAPRTFQLACQAKSGHIMLRAPTGSGKTEAAQYWIQNNQHTIDGRLSKIYFVLPFQASINAMFSRLGEWIGVAYGMIGLQHSRAAQVLFSHIKNEVYSEKPQKNIPNKVMKRIRDPWDNLPEISSQEPSFKSSLLLNEGYLRSFSSKKKVKQPNSTAAAIARLTRENFYPIKVTTPHQILAGVLHGRGWEVNVQEFERACFVFDEIHIYDPHLTGLILGMASVLIKQFKAQVMFMSASFPTQLIRLIQETIDPDIPLIELDATSPSDAAVLNRKRHKIIIERQPMTQLCKSEEFQILVKSSETVLLICNTVAVAQEVFSLLQSSLQLLELTEEEIMLFHSRFKMKDRKEKEEKLANIATNDLRVVVATQVVEVSLDIDFAVGIIEAAPLDALVQRLGRVNRSGKRRIEGPNIVITEPEGYSSRIYKETITNATLKLLGSVENQALGEMQLVELIDDLYTNHGWSQSDREDFERAFNHNNYQDFFKIAVPGTYKRWIDEVILDDKSVDVLLLSDIQIYKSLLKEEPLEALDLLIPTRIARSEYQYKDKDLPPILSDRWNYSTIKGLYKEDTT